MASTDPAQAPNCNTATDPGSQILCFLQSPFASQLQAGSIGVAAGYSFGFTALAVIYFSLIRPRHHIVYEPKVKYADKKHCPPPLGSGIFDWIVPTMKTKEDVIIQKVGLDAAIFLRFTRMLRNLFLVLAVLGCSILLPVHITQSEQFPNREQDVSTYVIWMTPQMVPPNVMWAHVVMAYVFNIIVLSFIWWNHRAVARIRKNYFQSPEYQHSLHSRSLWMVDIPAPLRSDEGILQIIDSVEHTASLPRAAIARNVKDLPELIEEHTETVKKLESVLAKYLKNPNNLPAQRPTLRPSKRDHRADHNAKVDAIDYLARRVKELEMEIKDVRESIDKRNAMPYGFATYDRIEEAHTVAWAARNKHPKGTTINLAPKPNDFIWKNMPLSKRTRARKRFVANLWVALLTILWIAPNAFIAIFLVNLSNLGALSSGFNASWEANKGLWSVVQALLGPTLLSTFYLCLPIIFRRLSMRAGDLTKTSREKHVTHKLYAFFVFNNLVVFSVFSTIWTFISTVIAKTSTGKDAWSAIQAADFSKALLGSLCSVSVFWITWLLQRNLTAAIDVSQIWQLFLVWFQKTFLAPTPRQRITWTAPQPFDYAMYMNYYLFYATVTLSNAFLQPIVLVCGLIIFAIEAYLKKYLLLYVYITKTESGGRFWNVLTNRLLFGLAVSHVVGALVIKGVQVNGQDWTTYTQLFCMVPLWFIIMGFKWYSLKHFEPQCKYYTKAIPPSLEAPGDANKKRRNERIAVKFGHPALYKPLITPMVAANAQHVLHTLIGDMDGYDSNQNQAYGDSLAMGPMSDQPGTRGMSVSGGAADMFEVVPEANMDFAYFKNRADFGDEHGGGGELYGRAGDLVSERSGTPASFLTQDSDDARSAAGTPPPMPLPRQQQDLMNQNHPAFRGPSRDQSPLSMYGHQRNDSQSRLLQGHMGSVRGYEPVSREPLSREPSYGYEAYHSSSTPPQIPTAIPQSHEGGMYGLDRWRTGGSGYAGVNVPADHDMGYDTYRHHGRSDSGPRSPPYDPNAATPGSHMPYNRGNGRSSWR